jgi:hypothetical protein
VVSAGDDGALREWDAESGAELAAFPEVGVGPIAVNPARLVAVSNPDQQIVTVVDAGRRGELGAFATCDGSAVDDSLATVGSLAVVLAVCDDQPSATALVIDLVGDARLHEQTGREFGALAISPDGSMLVDQPLEQRPDGSMVRGPLTLSALGTDAPIHELEQLAGVDEWPFVARVRWSPNGKSIAAALGSRVAVWDASDGRLLARADSAGEDIAVVDILFNPDSAALIWTTTDRRITQRRLDTWDDAVERDLVVDGAYRAGLSGFTAGGSGLILVGGFQANAASALVWLDPQTFDVQRLLPNVHEGSVTATALSPDGTLLATAASDGSVRVWDTETGDVVHDTGTRPSAVRGVAFDGADRLVLALDGGGLEIVTVDAATLLELVRGSLNRGFSQSECSRFNLGGRCPTLDDLRDVEDGGASALAGTFSISWTEREIESAVVDDLIAFAGAPLPSDFEVGFAADLASRFQFSFAGTRFELTADGTDPICVGTVRVHGDRVSLMAERGRACNPTTLLEARFTLADDQLTFVRDGMRAEYPWMIAFGTRPLNRTG